MSDTISGVKVSQQHATRPPPIALGINVEKPKFPQYAVYSKRLESFDSWPAYLPVQMKDMVEAGLVYTGVGDSVRCYFCGGGLRNWESGNVPMEEHAKWYPKCPHILLVKGQTYIEKISHGEKPKIVGAIAMSSKQAPTDSVKNKESFAAQSCIDMGFSKEIVAKAIKIFISKNDETLKTVADTISLLVKRCPQLFPDLSRKPTEQDLVKFAEAIGGNFQLLGYALGLSDAKLDQIFLDNPTTVMKTYHMLKEWTDKNPLKSTVSSLIQTMKSCRSVTIDWQEIGKLCM